MKTTRLILSGLLGSLVLGDVALGQYQRRATDDLDGAFQNEVIEDARSKAGIDEKLGEFIPRDLVFTNANGQQLSIGDVLDEGKPVIIQMAYYRCPQLCGEVMNGMVRSMLDLAGDYEISQDFEVITVSFDSREDVSLARSNKDATVDVMSREFEESDVESGWNFWVGDDLNIERLADAIGFRFAWIPEAQEYSHTGTIVLVTPDGKVSRYLQGPRFEAQTLRLSLVGASEGRLQPSLKDAFILYCFSFDPTTGRYTATAMTVMKIGGATTVVTLGIVILFLLHLEKKGRLRRHPNAGTPIDEVDDVPPPSAPSSGGKPHAFA